MFTRPAFLTNQSQSARQVSLPIAPVKQNCAIQWKCKSCPFVNSSYAPSLKEKFELSLNVLKRKKLLPRTRILPPGPSQGDERGHLIVPHPKLPTCAFHIRCEGVILCPTAPSPGALQSEPNRIAKKEVEVGRPRTRESK